MSALLPIPWSLSQGTTVSGTPALNVLTVIKETILTPDCFLLHLHLLMPRAECRPCAILTILHPRRWRSDTQFSTNWYFYNYCPVILKIHRLVDNMLQYSHHEVFNKIVQGVLKWCSSKSCAFFDLIIAKCRVQHKVKGRIERIMKFFRLSWKFTSWIFLCRK